MALACDVASTSSFPRRRGLERVGTHSESGTYSMDDWLGIYAAQAFDHADQIRRARGATPGT